MVVRGAKGPLLALEWESGGGEMVAYHRGSRYKVKTQDTRFFKFQDTKFGRGELR